MRKAGLTVMVLSALAMLVFGIVFYHGTTDNVVDSGGFWAYMYGVNSVPWLVYSGGVTFLMGLTMFISTWPQPARRY